MKDQKKLSLKDVHKALKREEMRMIAGGSGSHGCNVGLDCMLVTVGGSGQATTTMAGRCSMATLGTTISCFCNTGNGNPIDLTSNSGVSRCWTA